MIDLNCVKKPSQLSQSFANSLDFRHNSFGAIRLFLALAVLYHHTFFLGSLGKEPLAEIMHHQEDVGSLAVLCFFIISGFLVTNSLIHSDNVIIYSAKRFLRIYPAFWVCLLVTSLIFAPLVAYFNHVTLNQTLSGRDGSLSYLKHNFFIFMHQYNIKNLLASNPYPRVFDGSLWTLILEVKAYIVLGILGVVGIIRKKWLVLLFFLFLSFIFVRHIVVPEPHEKFLRFFIDNSVLMFLTYFFSGVTFYLFQDKIPFSKYFFFLAIVLVCLAAAVGVLHQILPFVMPYIIFYLAAKLPLSFISAYGDFSYGIYIYAFPIQQILTFFRFNQSFFFYILLSVILTLFCAILSWYLVEKPSLGVKKVGLKQFTKYINYSFLLNTPRAVPSNIAKSAMNWRTGSKKKARKSRM